VTFGEPEECEEHHAQRQHDECEILATALHRPPPPPER
jgi:hypothetical protein